MPLVSSLLNTVDITYRNSYSQAQKLEWMNETQKQIFKLVRHEAKPHTFMTVSNYSLYPLPDDCDPYGIKQVVIANQGYDSLNNKINYTELTFVSLESDRNIGSGDRFYSVAENNKIFLNPLPNANDEGRVVYVYYNKRPTNLTLNVVPDLEEDFQELLVLGTLERIARARGEYDDKNVFANDFQELLKEYQKQYRQPYPEYSTPKDMLPRRRGHFYVGGRGRRPYTDGLIPD
ncbi:phage adaptor protein [Paenibacillus sp. FSL L8-0499]|uniref:phage adaptor protein n=1 Tax=Paenibacillus sp. FSL L8-0499 TaxID=2975334 RepID=UPI0030FC475F